MKLIILGIIFLSLFLHCYSTLKSNLAKFGHSFYRDTRVQSINSVVIALSEVKLTWKIHVSSS